MKKHINLLPLKHRKWALLRRLLVGWCAVGMVGGAVFSGVFWLNKRHQAKTLALLSKDELSSAPILAAAQANDRMRDEVKRFGRHETLVGQLHDDMPVLGLLASISRCARLSDGGIVIRDLQFQQASGQAAPPLPLAAAEEEAETPERKAVLTIEGDARDIVTMAGFAAALRGTAVFGDVELRSSAGKPRADRPLHSFVIHCEI